MFCLSLFVLLHFFFWPLCCLFFFDIRFLIAPLVSSNSSYNNATHPGIYNLKVCILLSFRKHIHDRILSLREEDWAHRPSATPPHSIELPVQSQKWSIMCVMSIDFASIPGIALLYFGTVPTVLYILIFHFCYPISSAVYWEREA